MNKELQYPRLVNGIFVINKKGDILLFESPKWDNKLVPPGGHVEFEETIADAAIREVKEETNLNIKNVENLKVVEFINSNDYVKHKHIVSVNCKAELDGENQEVKLDGREGISYVWISPKDAIKDERVEEMTRNTILEYLVPQKSKMFNKKCKNCTSNEEKCNEYKDGWQRALADYKNLQNEINKKKSDWIKMSEVQILEEFLPVYEHLKMSIENEEVEKMDNPWVNGVKHVLKQFKDIMSDHGVKEIETVGQKFDPRLHEVVDQVKDDNVESDEIIKNVGVGYIMGERVLKAAKVIISK